jgi:hypothetical protein
LSDIKLPKSSFTVMFDGDDYDNHEIKIMMFARSLTALGDVLYEASEEINGSRDAIDVRINAKFIEGSFGFEVDVFQLIESAKNIVEIIGFTKGATAASAVGGLMGLMNWLDGEKIASIDESGTGVIVETETGKSQNYTSNVARLAENKTIRTGLEKLIRAPLQDSGTSYVKIYSEGDSKETSTEIVINKEEAKSYKKLAVKELKESTYTTKEVRVKFIGANVRKKTGWQIEINDVPYTSKMMDELFIERLKNMEEAHIFGRTFNIKFGTRVITQYGKTSTTYEIETVHYESKK